MAKRRYNFGQTYLDNCRIGIAMIKGEQWFWLTDGYTRWLVTDMNHEMRQVETKVWADA